MYSGEVRSFRGNIEAHLRRLTAFARSAGRDADLIASAPSSFDDPNRAAAEAQGDESPSALRRFLSACEFALAVAAFTAFVTLYVASLLVTWDEYDPFWNYVGLVTMGLGIVLGGAAAFYGKFRREGDE